MPIDPLFSPDTPVPPQSDLNIHTTGAWEIDLPRNWRVVPSGRDNTVTFQSDADDAALMIDVDFYDIPPDKARSTAERLINARLATLEQQDPGQVDMFDSGVQSHRQGQGLEMYYAAHIAKRDVVMYFVYILPQRVMNLTLVSKKGRNEAMALLRAVHSHFRPKLA
jgi:putative component of toxin-antitoxin plasmid stabilization module